MPEVYDKRQHTYRHMEDYEGKNETILLLRLIGVKAHSHHNCCQLFAEIYGPKERGFEEGVEGG